jgi:hypothetical protein
MSYDQLAVNGTVTLAGSLSPVVGYAAQFNDSYALIDNDGTDAVNGIFVGLPQGAVVSLSGQPFIVSYADVTGNDVTLTRGGTPVAPPRVANLRVNNGAAQRSMVTSLTVTFDQAVAFAGPAAQAFTLARINGGSVGFTATVSNAGGVTAVTLDTFTGPETNQAQTFRQAFGSLNNGRYALTVRASQVSAGGLALDGNGDGVGGDDYVFADSGTTAGNQLYRLFGDADGNRVVNINDLALFRAAFGTTTSDPTFDYDLSEVINANDLSFFRANFGLAV